jgi:Spy/CpxP family protein refolding chaperone
MQITLVAAVVAMAASPALAQERQRQRQGGGFGGFGGGVMLLGQKSVQEELKLSEDQVKKIQDLQAKQREAFQGFGDLSQEERRTKMQELNKANNEAVAKILKPEQVKRFKEISLQQQVRFGVGFVLNNEEVAKALKITDEQKEKIREIQSKSREELQGVERNEEGLKKIQEVRKATSEKVMGVLTAEQKEQLKKMQGEPFKGEIQFGGRRQQQN